MPSVDSKGKSPRNCSRIVLQLIEESKLPDECSNSIDNSSGLSSQF